MHINDKDTKLQFLLSTHPPSFWWYKNTKVLSRKKTRRLQLPHQQWSCKSVCPVWLQHQNMWRRQWEMKLERSSGFPKGIWECQCEFSFLITLACFWPYFSKPAIQYRYTPVCPNAVRVLCVSLVAVNSVFRVLFCFVLFLSWFCGAYHFNCLISTINGSIHGESQLQFHQKCHHL